MNHVVPQTRGGSGHLLWMVTESSWEMGEGGRGGAGGTWQEGRSSAHEGQRVGEF